LKIPSGGVQYGTAGIRRPPERHWWSGIPLGGQELDVELIPETRADPPSNKERGERGGPLEGLVLARQELKKDILPESLDMNESCLGTERSPSCAAGKW
jgi:hypothetical protein